MPFGTSIFAMFDPQSPMARSYIARNPNSAIARNWAARFGQAPSANPNTLGSNNAGGQVAPAPTAYAASKGGMDTGGNNATQGSDPTMGGFGIPSFAAGGMMSAQGQAIRPGQTMSSIPPDEPLMGADAAPPMDGAQIDKEAQNFIRNNPAEAQKVQAVIQMAIQTGELTIDELNQAVQLAKAALSNPASYPQIRQFAIQNGLGTEQDIPQEMDRGLLYILTVAGKSMAQAGSRQPSPGAGNAMMGQGPSPTQQPQSGLLPEYSEGGMTGDKAHIAKLHPREYVIPEEALLYHGKKHFDKLVEQARTPTDGTANAN